MKEALKLALEALESMKETLAEHDEPTTFNEDQAIIAIKEALAQPEQEPVAWEQFYPDIGKPQLRQEPVEDVVAYHSDGTRTVRIAPKRPWVGLTDEEIESCANWRWMTTCRAIEAKLKEKNT